VLLISGACTGDLRVLKIFARSCPAPANFQSALADFEARLETWSFLQQNWENYATFRSVVAANI